VARAIDFAEFSEIHFPILRSARRRKYDDLQMLWLICNLRRFDHITDALANLHWVRVPERVVFKVTVLTFKVLHGSAPEYLGPVVRFTDLPGRQALRSADTNRLVVPPFKLSTIGRRAFPVAGPQIWNDLPDDITFLHSLPAFGRKLKTYLFIRSFPNLEI
jgi:hypothetical protein